MEFPDKTEKVNPLQPFYLVYVQDDGTTAMSFVQAKQLLEAFKSLCDGHSTPIGELCHFFNEETRDGKDMSRYDDLLEKAMTDIGRAFASRNEGNLFAGRGGTLLPAGERLWEPANFQLITWLVIK